LAFHGLGDVDNTLKLNFLNLFVHPVICPARALTSMNPEQARSVIALPLQYA
jgi:hypothetical protein